MLQKAVVGGDAAHYYLAWPGDSTNPWTTSNGRVTFKPAEGVRGTVSLTVIGNAKGLSSSTDFTMVQCRLWNATYAADFYYDGGVQSVSSSITSYMQAVDARTSISALNFALGSATSFGPADYSYLLNWAYLAVMESFQDYIMGSVSYALSDNLGGSPTIDTNMILTTLPLANELQHLSSSINGLSQSTGENMSMKDMLEAMFRNATLSLASQGLLLQ